MLNETAIECRLVIALEENGLDGLEAGQFGCDPREEILGHLVVFARSDRDRTEVTLLVASRHQFKRHDLQAELNREVIGLLDDPAVSRKCIICIFAPEKTLKRDVLRVRGREGGIGEGVVEASVADLQKRVCPPDIERGLRTGLASYYT